MTVETIIAQGAVETIGAGAQGLLEYGILAILLLIFLGVILLMGLFFAKQFVVCNEGTKAALKDSTNAINTLDKNMTAVLGSIKEALIELKGKVDK